MNLPKCTRWICSVACLVLFTTIIKTTNAQISTGTVTEEINPEAATGLDEQEELLENYRSHRLDINSCTREEIASLHLISALQVEALISHRENFGNYLDMLELQSLPGFDRETIEKILPYIECRKSASAELRKIKSKPEQQLALFYQQPLQRSAGFLNQNDGNSANDFLGPDFRTSLRYRFKKGNKISFGLNAEKDIGEPFFYKKTNGFDFYSAYLFIKDIGLIRQLAIGDYQLNFGQGLAVGSGFAISKSIEVLQVRRYSSGIKPYRSMNETGFFRGAAAEIGTQKLSVFIYGSLKRTDGNKWVTDTLIFDEARYYAGITTGYHRTVKEIALKNTSLEKTAGTYLQASHKGFHAGAGAVYHDLGSSSVTVHSDISFELRNFNFFSEGAVMTGGGRAFLAGLMGSLHKDCDIVLLYRNYNGAYKSTLSNAFSNASPNNEKGLFIGLNLKLAKALSFSSYADIYSSPLPKYRLSGPSAGKDFTSALQYTVRKNFLLELRFRLVTGQVNTSSELHYTVNFPIDQERSICRFEASYKLNDEIKLRTRFEQTLWKSETGMNESGNMAFQDIIFQPNKKWGLILRYTFFRVDGGNARIYAFENDMPYSFDIIQLSGIGSEFYGMLDYKITRKCTLWLRYSGLYYRDKESRGSGLDEIQGNKKETLKILCRWSF
jgi:hypothetical protein